MSVIVDFDSKCTKLREQAFDFLLSGVSSHVSQFFVFISGEDFVNDACEFVGDGDFCFIF